MTMQQEYWVVGGRYRDTSFTTLAEDGVEAYGPFAGYDEALKSWSDRNDGTRAQAAVRYSIVTTASMVTGH
ncbi:MAG: DUF4170 domain-containing protein [Hyphomicrobiales bacterium]|nr:DUF4170 domain-containing protein [Hyphomicrobiales bacterium]